VRVGWPDLVRRVEQHPRLAAGALRVEAARGGVDAAGAAPNPTLEGHVGQGLARSGDGSRVEWGLELSVPLGWIAQRGSRLEAAEAGVEVALAEGQAQRREVLLRLQASFWGLAYEQAHVASLEAIEAQTAAMVHTVVRRVEQGEARPVEATRVEIEREKVAAELEAARTSLQARQAELALWLGLPASGALAAVADLDVLPVAPGRDAALSRARASHPALAAARARTRFLEAEASSERLARVPAFTLTGSTDHELDRRSYGVGLAVELPLWSWNSGRIAQAEAELAASRRQAEADGLEVEAIVLDAQAACHASVATARRFRDHVVPRAETTAATLERTYQLGETNLLEVLDARRTLLDARRLLLGALAQAHLDCSRLGVLVGEEPT